MMWGPFGPVVDGAGGILPQKPRDIRDTGEFLKVPMIAGVARDEGAYLAGIKNYMRQLLISAQCAFLVQLNTSLAFMK